MDNPQSQMIFITVEVALIVQQVVLIFDTVCGNETVDRLADSDSLAPQQPIIAGTLQSQFRTDHRRLGIFSEGAAGFFEISILPKALHNLRQDQVADQDRHFIHDLVKIIRLRSFDPGQLLGALDEFIVEHNIGSQ